MVTSQAVVIADDTAGLWPVLVILKDIEGKIRQLSVVLPDVQDIGVEIKIFIAIWVRSEQSLEPINGNIIFLRNIACMSDLVHDVDALLEVPVQDTIEVNWVFGLLLVQEEASIVEILGPMVS